MFKTIQLRYTFIAVVIMLLASLLTIAGIRAFVAPALKTNEEQLMLDKVSEITDAILLELKKVEAQSRSITQTIAVLDSDTIDTVVPQLVDQYGDAKVFGGGIWPLPQQRSEASKHSTFWHRDASGKMVVNTYWNSPESRNYFDEPWHKDGLKSPAGQCAWAAAYRDEASVQPRTNCAMAIQKDGRPYGVSTIDVTLGFFNKLVADKEQQIHGEVLVLEADGKILSNQGNISGDIVLQNVSSLASRSAFLRAVQKNLSSSAQGLTRDTYTGDDNNEWTFYLQPVAGTPWLVASALPSSLLSQNSNQVLMTLAKLQIPVIVALLGLMFLAIRSLVRRLQVLSHSIDSLSAGDADLTRRLSIKGADEVDAVGRSVNHFIEYLQKMIADVGQASTQMKLELQQLRDQSKHITKVLARHADETDQAVTAINEMSATADSVAQNATETENFTRAANQNAEHSKQVVAHATETVRSLNDDVDEATHRVLEMQQGAQKINDVLSVIGGIAEQTNLLALNAAIEAARAGEQGRGFAVVADEVRALAARTQQSTSEINSMLENLQQGVKSAVNAMEQTKTRCKEAADSTAKVNEGLDEMVGAVGQIHNLSAQIATAAEEQSAVSAEINKNMVAIHQMVDELVSAGQQTDSRTQSLFESNNTLAQLINRFKVD